ncbi:MAG: NAD(P)H-dependent oxidoreductase [Abditibacteriaceae bacterium]
MLPKLQIIICSTRPARVGPSVANWFYELASSQNKFDTQLIDLVDFNLPLLDEPMHPKLQQYQHAHTKAWSESVASADAYIFVTPEYNYSPTPALVNALDYVYSEWNYKPCGFVSYGGISGGLRAVQAAKMQITTLKMMPMVEGVMIPFVTNFLNDAGEFHSNESIDKSAVTLLDELLRWTSGLKAMRESFSE